MNFKETYKSMNDDIHGNKALMNMIINGEVQEKKKKSFFKFKPVYSVALAAVFAVCIITLYRNTGLEEHSAINDTFDNMVENEVAQSVYSDEGPVSRAGIMSEENESNEYETANVEQSNPVFEDESSGGVSTRKRVMDHESNAVFDKIKFMAGCDEILSNLTLPGDMTLSSKVAYPSTDEVYANCVDVKYTGEDGRYINMMLCPIDIPVPATTTLAIASGDIMVAISYEGLTSQELNAFTNSIVN